MKMSLSKQPLPPTLVRFSRVELSLLDFRPNGGADFFGQISVETSLRNRIAGAVSIALHVAILAAWLWPAPERTPSSRVGDHAAAIDTVTPEVTYATLILFPGGMNAPSSENEAEGNEGSSQGTTEAAVNSAFPLFQQSSDLAASVPTPDLQIVSEGGEAIDDYVEQIKARVDRAWERPWIKLENPFNCRLEVIQDNRGIVKQLNFLECEADSRWKESIVRAVGYAQPFPAAPESNETFGKIVLDFTASPVSSSLLAQVISTAQHARSQDQRVVPSTLPSQGEGLDHPAGD